MARSTKPWVGKTDDSKAPPRVRQRLFERAEGECHICKLPITPGDTWHLDHKVALILGGKNNEANLAPAHAHCNAEKGRAESKVKAKIAKIAQRHSGAKRPAGKLQGRGFETAPKRPRIDKAALPSLPRNNFYEATR